MLNETIWHELVYNQDNFLSDYLDGLPREDVMWSIALDGVVIPEEDWATTKVRPDANLVIVRIPEGGRGGGKNILRIVAMIAVLVVAHMLSGPLADIMASAAIGGAEAGSTLIAITQASLMVAGSMLVNAVLPAQTISPSQGPQSASYGIDGPKNTAREGVPVPVVYGEYQVGGNVVDCYTRNVGDDQYLFMRTVLNDGAVAGIDTIQLNGQDITTYKDVEYRVNLGVSGETPVSWFNEAIRMNNVSQKITQGGVTYSTFGDVDRLRVDVSFPLGLIQVVQKSGNRYDGVVDLGIKYRALNEDGTVAGDGSWLDLPLEAEEPLDTSGGSGIYTVPASKAASFTLTPAAPTSGDQWSITAQYKKPTDVTWTTLGTKTGTYQTATQYGDVQVLGASLPYATGTTLPTVTWDMSFPSVQDWEVEFIGGAVQNNTENNPNLNSSTKDNLVGQVNSLHVVRQTQSPFRLTYQSSTLPRGRYEVMVTRADVENPDPGKPSQCWVSDIGEIDNENVTYEGSAMLSLKVKLTDQLSSQPTLTARVAGSLVNIYDDDGNIIETAWSDNPADITMDVLLNPERGGAGDPTKVIWSKIAEWRAFCELNNLKFNGVFDFVTTMWDALQSVARVGHATFLPQGTRYSVAIDQPADPTMVFNGSNMYLDTFKKSWIGIDDRANEIQQQFFDRNDFYKQKTIRLPDVQRQSIAQQIKPASASGFGINNVEQAVAEAEYQARQNSYIRSSIDFDAPIEAVALSIGDVALIQHDSSNYAEGVGGRLETGSTATVINLDRPVTMTAGNSYTLLVTTDALKIYDVTVTNIAANKVTVTGIAAGTQLPRIRRLIQGTVDREVTKIVDLATGSWVLTLDDTDGLTPSGAASLWDTDIIEERGVVFVEGESSQVTLTSALPGPPKQFSTFLFGQVQSVKQPYRLRTISGDDDLYRRTLSFVQYDERVYEPGSWGTPILGAATSGGAVQVLNLSADWDKNPLPDQQRITVRLNWNRPETQTGQKPYAGADVYFKTSSGLWTTAGSVSSVTIFSADFNRGDVLTFKVLGYDADGKRANFDSAPTVQVSLNVYDIDLDPPHDLATTIAAWNATATGQVSWTASTSDPAAYRVDYKLVDQATYTALTALPSPIPPVPSNPDDPVDTTGIPAAVLDDAGWQTLGRMPGLSANVPGLSVNNYVVRVRAERGWAASHWAYVGLDVEAPGLPAHVTGLRLNGGTPDAPNASFVGLDASWTWDDVLVQAAAHPIPGVDLPSVFLDYQVTILDLNDNVIRVEYTSSPGYTYTFAKNVADSVNVANANARRSFKIAVSIRSKQGTFSLPTTQVASNPPPAVPTGIADHEDVNGVIVNWDQCREPDYAGTVVWLGSSADFNVASADIVFSGAGSTTRITVPTKDQWFIKVGHYDAFSNSPVNITAGFSLFIPTVALIDLQNIADQGTALQAEIDDVATHTLDMVVKYPLLQTSLEGDVNDALSQSKAYTDLLGTSLGTALSTETQQRTDGQTALTQTLSIIGAKSGDGLSFILDLNKTKVSPTESLSTRLSSIQSTLDGNTAAINSESTTRANADSALAQSITTLTSTVNGHTASIASEQTTRANADSALAQSITQLTATVNGNSAAIQTEQTARANGDSALASTLSLLGAQNSQGTAFILDLNKTQVGGGVSLATRLSGIDANLNSNSAAISQEQTTRANADSANASSISSLTTTVNGHTASITSLQSSVNGMSAMYGVSLDVNGHITGFVMNNNGSSGSFVVVADHFAFVDPGNAGNVKVPFQYTSGVLYLTNTVIDGSLLVHGTITGDKIVGGAVSNIYTTGDVNQFTQLTINSPVGVATQPLHSDGGQHVIYVDIEATANSGTAGVRLQLFRDGNPVGATRAYIVQGSFNAGRTVVLYDQPGAGDHTYTVEVDLTPGSGTNTHCTLCSLISVELKV